MTTSLAPAVRSVVLVGWVLLAVGSPLQAQSGKDAATLADFRQRLGAYVALQQKLQATLPKLPADARPDQYIDRQRALARLIQSARIGARPGDIVTRRMRDLLRARLQETFRGPDGRQVRAGLFDEYTGTFRATINGSYPEDAPVSSMPPQVLRALPDLPQPIEYRFIDKKMILFDKGARLIVEIVEKVL